MRAQRRRRRILIWLYLYAIIHLARAMTNFEKNKSKKKNYEKKNGTIKCYLVRMQDNVNGAPPAACSLMFAINNYCLRQNVCARAAHGKFRAAYHFFFSSYAKTAILFNYIFSVMGCIKRNVHIFGDAGARAQIYEFSMWQIERPFRERTFSFK